MQRSSGETCGTFKAEDELGQNENREGWLTCGLRRTAARAISSVRESCDEESKNMRRYQRNWYMLRMRHGERGPGKGGVADVDGVTQRTQSTEHEGHEQAESDVTAVTNKSAMGLLEEELQPAGGRGWRRLRRWRRRRGTIRREREIIYY